MKKVYSSENVPLVGYLKSILDSHNIDCFVKNEHLSAGAGELPPIECWPELWVTDATNYVRAKHIVDTTIAEPLTQSSDWSCQNCGELIEGQFGVCWQCGQSPP